MASTSSEQYNADTDSNTMCESSRLEGRGRLPSRAIAGMAHTVIVEDLRVEAMTHSARGTAEEPSSWVRQKAGLNRVILDTSWA